MYTDVVFRHMLLVELVVNARFNDAARLKMRIREALRAQKLNTHYVSVDGFYLIHPARVYVVNFDDIISPCTSRMRQRPFSL